MEHDPVLTTPRLILRVLDRDDLDAVMRVHGDPEVMRFSVGGAKTGDEVVGFIDRAAAFHRRDGFSQWAVVLRDTGACIGECGILRQEIEGRGEHEISYRLARAAWGRGIATEAAAACRDFALGSLRLARVVSIIDPRNAASMRVAHKIGMRHEGDARFHGIAVAIYGVGAIDRVPRRGSADLGIALRCSDGFF